MLILSKEWVMLKRLFNLFAIVSLILSIFTIASCTDNSKPYEKVSVTYMEAVFNADTDTVLETIYIKDRRSEKEQRKKAEEKLNAFLPEVAKDMEAKAGGVKSVKVVKSELNEAQDTAKVTVQINYKKKFNNATNEKVELTVVKIEDKWKVIPTL